MKQKMLHAWAALCTALTTIILLGIPAFAGVPMTGDRRGQNIGFVGILLGVSVVLIIAVVALSFLGKGGKGKKK